MVICNCDLIARDSCQVLGGILVPYANVRDCVAFVVGDFLYCITPKCKANGTSAVGNGTVTKQRDEEAIFHQNLLNSVW